MSAIFRNLLGILFLLILTDCRKKECKSEIQCEQGYCLLNACRCEQGWEGTTCDSWSGDRYLGWYSFRTECFGSSTFTRELEVVEDLTRWDIVHFPGFRFPDGIFEIEYPLIVELNGYELIVREQIVEDFWGTYSLRGNGYYEDSASFRLNLSINYLDDYTEENCSVILERL